ncbi:hypothetical protein C4D60_Mb10t24450 [Musa balbisiana]|uniref:Kinetochore protein SPC25 n=1 Tax=Musa balbisiana TaxID=52838 RepID=A0A4S8IZE9_MUSBA|nr:hypothetical protein C4D60_Mb10t24450 [Musa balbisiana]
MQRRTEESIHGRMAEQRFACIREIEIQRQRADLAASSFRHSLLSVRSLSGQNLADREKLGRLKDSLKELEADLVEALSVKTGKESKSTFLAEALSSTASRTEQLKKTILDLRRKRDKHSAVISEQLLALEALEVKSSQYILERQKTEEAIEWYNKILGFRAECGEGVKFIFDKIDRKNPNEEYSFSIRLDNDTYNLLDCNTILEGIPELIMDLNKTNGLFKFARIMREKFQVAASNGMLPTSMSVYPDSSSVTVSSAPPASVDSKSETSVMKNDLRVKVNNHQYDPHKKVNTGQPAIQSPRSVSALRRSPRFLVMFCKLRSQSA